MYESHFGLSAAPFSLNPDPAFFFGSRGHSHALSYLKFGVYQGEGFVVVTGEIGAGKTTLVRTLLSELDRDRIVAAQIVSTQLEAGDLLRSVALAFGIAPKSLSKAELIATIEAFLTLLVTENKRALLIVDEAQNLNREAVEELRMLSNFQLGSQALLQSFLVGQPELRVLLTSKPMEQFRQRVIASCHLGPMDVGETQGYIEHRLQQVGWTGRPVFDTPAYERIFHWTGGIPRRVNMLCNRLMLSAYLTSQDRIDAGAVDTIGDEVRGEVGESAARLAPTRVPDAPVQAPAPSQVEAVTHAVADPDATVPVAVARPPATVPVQNPAQAAGPLVVVAANGFDDVKTAVLLRALKSHKGVPRIVRVAIGDAARFTLDAPFHAQLGIDMTSLGLEVCEALPTDQIAEVMKQFGMVVEEHRPGAVLVVGGSESALACALVGRKKDCRVVHVEAGSRAQSGGAGGAVNDVLIDRMADAFYPAEMPAYLSLIREGVADADVQHAGSLLVDAVHAVPEAALPALVQADGTPWQPDASRGYALVAVEQAIAAGDAEAITELLSSLREISREKHLVWPMAAATAAKLAALGLDALVRHERIAVVDPVGFTESVRLSRSAAFVVTDSRDIELQAALLQRRCLSIDGPVASTSPAKPLDSGAAARIAEHLVQWLTAKAAAVAR
ncbi:MAG TPA: XrtA/PEP-CTERM system-associated ATPase [Albitalea sp.]|uniref:XrtA/PEP-CTERM system-associated ATPase n=1 Tax=Piscinibacter sp. TaxID=1903157 RepID=UPI002ED0C61C